MVNKLSVSEEDFKGTPITRNFFHDIYGERIGKAKEIIKAQIDILEKGGEGSKGGKIIGHTQSGKPIYFDKKPADYKDFNKKDHYNASQIHEMESENYTPSEGTEGWKSDHHMDMASDHENYAEAMPKKSKQSKKKK